MRRAVAVLAGLVAVACSTPPAGGRVAASPAAGGPQVAQGLTAAQQDMFDNRYTAADVDYARLLTTAPNVADVHAALALFLNYRSDFGDALTQATRAVALDPRSGAAAAVLCRVEDWSGDVSHAVASGRSAVQA